MKQGSIDQQTNGMMNDSNYCFSEI